MKKACLLIFISFFIQFNYAQCWEKVVCGQHNILGLQSDGSIWVVGDNYYGQLGNQSSIYDDEHSFIMVGDSYNWNNIEMGDSSILAMNENNQLLGWGFNGHSQLGIESDGNIHAPELVENDSDFQVFSMSQSHTLGIKNDGSLWAVGYNNRGQLGKGDNVDSDMFVQIGDDTWNSVATGLHFSLAIKSNGTLWVWGENISGSFGIEDNDDNSNIPIQIGSDTDWLEISVGHRFCMAIKTDGTLWAWGYNGFGTLGDGTNIDRNIPTQIGTDTNWKSISCGYNFTMALKTDGTLWSWGKNNVGQLGDGTNTNRNVPNQVGSDMNWSSLDVGDRHTAAIKENNTLWTWGYNGQGQLANGSDVNSNTPININCENLAIPEYTNSKIIIYPNPASNFINFKNLQNNITDLNIYDIGGKLISSKKINDGLMPIGDLPTGIYFIEIPVFNGNQFYKFIKD